MNNKTACPDCGRIGSHGVWCPQVASVINEDLLSSNPNASPDWEKLYNQAVAGRHAFRQMAVRYRNALKRAVEWAGPMGEAPVDSRPAWFDVARAALEGPTDLPDETTSDVQALLTVQQENKRLRGALARISAGTPDLLPPYRADGASQLRDIAIKALQQSSPLEPDGRLPAAFQSLLDLQPNWDSYGAKRINRECVQKAYEIWKQLAGTWLPFPHSDGTVGLEQHQGGFDIEIDVDLSQSPENGSPVTTENM